jgi:hypothetical protein
LTALSDYDIINVEELHPMTPEETEKAYLPPAVCDERLILAFREYAWIHELSGKQVITKALDYLNEYFNRCDENRVEVVLSSPMKYKFPNTFIGKTRIANLKRYCAMFDISVSQGVREAIALFLGLNENKEVYVTTNVTISNPE